MSTHASLNTVQVTAKLLAVVLVVMALYLARDLFIPIILAVLLSFLLSPVARRLEIIGLGNTASVLATVAVAFSVLLGTLWLLGSEVSEFVGQIPNYKSELIEKSKSVSGIRKQFVDRFQQFATEVTTAADEESGEKTKPDSGRDAKGSSTIRETDATEATADQDESKMDAEPSEAGAENDSQTNSNSNGPTSFSRFSDLFRGAKTNGEGDPGQSPEKPLFVTNVDTGFPPLLTWAGTVGSILGPIGTIGLVAVFEIFLLMYRYDLRDRIINLVSRGDYATTTEAMEELAHRITRYLAAQSMVNVTYAFTLGLGLTIVGWTMAPAGQFPNAVLWGAVAGLLRFIPYFGPIVGAVFPLSVALAVFPGYSVFLAVALIIIVMELLSNNIFEPLLYGASTGLSPIAVIVSAVFWGWLWGPMGLLLSTPLTVCLVVLGQYIPAFHTFTILLGETLPVSDSLRYYQRILAGDVHEAQDILYGFASTSSLPAAIDRLYIPTIKRLKKADGDKSKPSLNVESLHSTLQSSVALAADRIRKHHPELQSADASTSEVEQSPTEASEVEHSTPFKVVAVAAHGPADYVMLESLKHVFQTSNPLSIKVDFLLLDFEVIEEILVDDILEEKPDAVLVAVVPPGGLRKARAITKTLSDRGFEGSTIAACFGKFKHHDRMYVRFRQSGANYFATSVTETMARISKLIKRRMIEKPVEIH